jgi:hypothetical protein
VLAGLGVTDDGCTSPIDTISILLRAIVENTTANTRYDVGLWVATDGDPNADGAETGICARETLVNPSGVLDSISCTDLDLTCGAGPYYDADLDSCGDLLAVTPDCGQVDDVEDPLDGPCTTIDGLEDPSVLDFAEAVTFPCTDSDSEGVSDGFVNIDICLSYGNQPGQVDFGGSNGTCDSAAELEPGTNAKCQCEEYFNTNILVPNLSLSCSCSGGTIPGGFTTCTVSMANTDLPACTPDLAISEPYRCGTAAFMRFEADYDESNLSVDSSSTTSGTTSDSGTVLTWNPQSGAGTANIIGEGDSGTMTVRFDIDGGAATGTYSTPVTAVWSVDSAFTTPVSQSLTANCDVVVMPTWALVSDFSAQEDHGTILVDWRTSAEAGTLGFYLERQHHESQHHIGGTWEAVHPHLIPSMTAGPGGTYRVVDPTESPGRFVTYRLVEATTDGRRRLHGPWTVKIEPSAAALNIPQEGVRTTPHQPTERQRARLATSRDEVKLARNHTFPESLGQRLKMEVEFLGLHQVSAVQIAETLGVLEQEVRKSIRGGAFRLSHHGEEVAWEAMANDAGLRFFAERINSVYTRTDVYWLERGRGLEMVAKGGPGPAPAAPGESFNEVFHLEEDLLPRPFSATAPQQDYWFWDLVITGRPTFGHRSLDLHVPAVASTDEGTLLVLHFWGFAQEEQQTRVWLNGTLLGDLQWDGAGPPTQALEVASSVLHTGINTVEVEGLEGSFFIDSFDAHYRRLYQAASDALLLFSEDPEVITVTGFTSGDINVYNVDNPRLPKRVLAITVDQGPSGSYRASFLPAKGRTRYLVAAGSGRHEPVGLRRVGESTLRNPLLSGEYLVLAPTFLLEPAQALADHRESQGLNTLVADVEDVYNEFAHGLKTPVAIADFLAWTAENWEDPPRYVVLLGDGHFDYKDLLGLGGNLLPPLLHPTSLGLIPADNRLVASKGIPTTAIGRIPALTTEEAFAYIDKLVAHENSIDDEEQRRFLMVADNSDTVGDYPTDSERLVDELHQDIHVERAYLGAPLPIAETRKQVLKALREGVDFLGYSGHGGLDRFATEGILKNGDAADLGNGDRLPVVTGLSCFLNYYAFPGFQSVGEEFTLAMDGGAIAVWAAAGLSGHHEVTHLGVQFFRELGQKRWRLGDLVLAALASHVDNSGNPELVSTFNLLGDPALRLPRIPRTPEGPIRPTADRP